MLRRVGHGAVLSDPFLQEGLLEWFSDELLYPTAFQRIPVMVRRAKDVDVVWGHLQQVG